MILVHEPSNFVKFGRNCQEKCQNLGLNVNNPDYTRVFGLYNHTKIELKYMYKK